MNTDQMMRELRATFPTLWMRPLREFSPQYECSEGIWTGSGHCAVMPDGTEVFNSGGCEEEGYEGDVHDGFAAWLARRGWSWDRYDGATFFLVPRSYFDEPAGPESREFYEAWDRSVASHKPLQPGELPF